MSSSKTDPDAPIVLRAFRAQLLSHGLGGVQNRHYDRHDYALEKRQALEHWARHLTKLKAAEASTAPALYPSEKQRRVNVGI